MDSIDQQATRAVEHLTAFLHARIVRGDHAPLQPVEVSADIYAELVKRNRLGATLYASASEIDIWPVSKEQVADWKREAYRRAVSQPQQLHQATQLARVLEANRVSCICMRGPFIGSRLFGDASWRPFSDVDLLVPREHARQAWSAAETSGFELFQENMPLGYFLRHHLHWQMKHAVSGLLCDLHWAVEHPYRLYRIDYAGLFARSRMVEVDGLTWREPDPADLFLLLAMHLKKHMPSLVRMCTEDDAIQQVFLHGEALHIVDLALLMKHDASMLDGARLLQTAEDWQCLDALAAGLECVARMFAMELPGGIREAAHARIPAWQTLEAPAAAAKAASRWWAIAAFKGGFRTEKMADAWTYLNPPPAYFGDKAGPARFARRHRHQIKAAARLSFAGVDTLVSVCVALLRGKRKGPAARTNVPMGIA
jgi:hypothetical protein